MSDTFEAIANEPFVHFYLDEDRNRNIEEHNENELRMLNNFSRYRPSHLPFFNIRLKGDPAILAAALRAFGIRKFPVYRFFGHNVYLDDDFEKRMQEIEAALSAEARDFLDDFVLKDGITLFIKGSVEKPECKFTRRLVRLLPKYGSRPVKELDILKDPKKRYSLKFVTGQNTFPMVFIDGDLIGGVDAFAELVGATEEDTADDGHC